MLSKRLIVILLLFLCCGNGSDSNTVKLDSLNEENLKNLTVFNNILTLQMSFGDYGLKDEFLLAIPAMILVDNNDNMLVYDEKKMKVFNSEGKEVTIFGRPGIGPGEFGAMRMASSVYMSESGYITQLCNRVFNVFKPDYSWLETKNFLLSDLYATIKKMQGYDSCTLHAIYALDDKKRLLTGVGGKGNLYYFLALYNGESTVVIDEYKWVDETKNRRARVSGVASFVWEELLDSRVIYSYSGKDTERNENGIYYILNMYDINRNEYSKIMHRYIPVEISSEVIDRISSIYIGEEEQKEVKKILKEFKYRPPLRSLRADGNYLFAFTYLKNSKDEIYVDVFDTKTMKYLHSAYFPFIPRLIKNGFAYRINRPQKEFATVEKYKIDDIVYGVITESIK